MALALEPDFRSVKTGPAPDRADRRPDKSGSGEAFANRLRDARDAERDNEAADAPDQPLASDAAPASAIVSPAPAGPAKTGSSTGTVSEAETIEAVDLAELNLKSEIVIDREVVREHEVKVEADDAALPAGTATDLAGADTEAAAAEVLPVLSAETGGPPAAAEPVEAKAGRRSDEAPEALAQSDAATLETAAAASGDGAPAVSLAALAVPQEPAPLDRPGRTTGKVQSTAKPVAEIALPQPAAQAAQPIALPDSSVQAALVSAAIATSEPGMNADTAAQAIQAASGVSMGAPGASAPQASAPAAAPVPMAPANAIITASPAHVVDIVSSSIDDGQSDHVVVQLDPPELGRVSIDFKFDAHGLQHVTITGETPEALRQLRMMHTDLVQALERQGLNSQNMTFQQHQQQSQQTPSPNAFVLADASAEQGIPALSPIMSPADNYSARTLPGGRLDIRL